MQNESSGAATEQSENTNSTDESTTAVVESTGKQLPVADGGFGPLDSDDIEWLIENKRVWLP